MPTRIIVSACPVCQVNVKQSELGSKVLEIEIEGTRLIHRFILTRLLTPEMNVMAFSFLNKCM